MQTILHRFSLACLKRDRQRIAILFAAGLVSVLVVGYRPYVTNAVEHGRLLYPPASVIIGSNLPAGLDGAGHLAKLADLLLARTGGNLGGQPWVLKLPFQVYAQELRETTGAARSGGFGPLFALVTLIAAGIAVVGMLRHRNEPLATPLLVIAGVIGLQSLVFPEPFWARHIPAFSAAVLLLAAGFANRVRPSALWLLVGIMALDTLPFVVKAGWSSALHTTHVIRAADTLRTFPGHCRVLVQKPAAVDFGDYVLATLRARGVNACAGDCSGDARMIDVPFGPDRVCVTPP